MTQYAFLFYHRCDDNMFETCVKTLRMHSGCDIIVATDNVPHDLQNQWSKDYGVYWIDVPVEQMKNRRAAAKIEILDSYVHSLEPDDQVFVSDVDMYFMKDPFTAFTRFEFDVAFTTRGYEYYFPINAGVFCLRVNDFSKRWISWHKEQIYDPTWRPYRDQNKRHRERFGFDWAVSQDFLISCWKERAWIAQTMNINIQDIGPEYNYCPPSDKWKQKAFEAIRIAYRDKTHVVLHLKSTLKDMLYEGLFVDAVIQYPRCGNDWFGEGKKT